MTTRNQPQTTLPTGCRTLYGLARQWRLSVNEAFVKARKDGWQATGQKDGNGDELYAPPGGNHGR